MGTGRIAFAKRARRDAGTTGNHEDDGTPVTISDFFISPHDAITDGKGLTKNNGGTLDDVSMYVGFSRDVYRRSASAKDPCAKPRSSSLLLENLSSRLIILSRPKLLLQFIF